MASLVLPVQPVLPGSGLGWAGGGDSGPDRGGWGAVDSGLERLADGRVANG